MKIGFYCESPADQAAMAIFTEGILGEPPQSISIDLEARSVPGFFSALDGVLRGVHYNSDAEGLVIVVDCDKSTLHETAHDAPDAEVGNCRFCQVKRIVDRTRKHLRPVAGKVPLKLAIGLTVPVIEAWYLVGKNHEVGEAAWRAGLTGGRAPFTAPELKRLVYGTDRPSLELETDRAKMEAQRIKANLTAIESAFPIGFGLMAAEIRSWRSRP